MTTTTQLMPHGTKYECDGCGECCRQLIIEINGLDVLREPRLADAATLCRAFDPATSRDIDPMTLPVIERDYMLACGKAKPCAFLGDDNKCGIYPTRPNVCVGLEPGDEQCQDCRESAGLPPLQPTAVGP